MKFLKNLENLLKSDERFISSDGKLLKPLVRDAAAHLDPLLIRALLDSSELSEHFFNRVDDIVVFDHEKFMWVVNSKEFLPDSYTKYRNRIGLSTDERSLLTASSEISLIWPYKDCVLEGGQEKETEARDEIFYNETLAPDEVGRLLAPKAFKNARRYVNESSEPTDHFSPEDNLIIRGNNLLALSSLLERYEGQVKCIYIDPPYNTGSDSFRYNDRFSRSSWLTFMKNRLDIAKRLLSRDGFILVQCDDNEQAYLKVLMDSVFGEQNFINVISVRTKVGGVTGSSAGKSLKDELEYINLFAKDRTSESATLTPAYVDTDLEEYIQSYKNSGKSWKYTSVLTSLEGRVLLEEDEVRGERLYGYSTVESKSIKAFAKEKGITEGEVYAKFADRIFRTTNAQSSVRTRVMGKASQYDFEMVGLEYTPSKGKNAGQTIEVLYKGKQQNMMMFLSDVVSLREGKYVYRDRVGTLWSDIQYNNLNKEGEVSFANGKKPEALIQRVLEMTTEPGDLVLDFFLGSGTTAVVAHKMGRRYVGVEQLNYLNSVTVPRLAKVLGGEQSGISRAQNWQGGGSFVYVELAEQGEKLMEELQEASSTVHVQRVLDQATDQGLLRASVLPSDLKTNQIEFAELSLLDQKALVAELIDKNRLYVNARDVEDGNLGLNTADIAFTKSFYEGGAK